MTGKPNILFVCGRNKKRSRTAEYIFKNDSRFFIRTAGLSEKSEITISENDLLWADFIFVMEDGQKARIQRIYREMDLPPIENLGIDDDYEYLDQELIGLLKEGINNALKTVFDI